MTIEDVIQELIDIKDWEYSQRNEYIYGEKYVEMVSGEYQFAISVRDRCIEIQKRNVTHFEMYFDALTESQLQIVKNIYRREIEKQLKGF